MITTPEPIHQTLQAANLRGCRSPTRAQLTEQLLQEWGSKCLLFNTLNEQGQNGEVACWCLDRGDNLGDSVTGEINDKGVDKQN